MILITGTDGFIGSYLKDFFIQNDYRVIGTTFIKEPEDDDVRIDFRKKEDFGKLPQKNFNTIIHAAGVVDQTTPQKVMMKINAEGTKYISDWALNHSCKHFVFISSVSAYGYRLLGENRSERITRRTRGIFGIPYMKSKAKAERYVERSGLKYTILRLPPVLGKDDTYLSPSIIPKLLKGTFYYCGKDDHKFSTLYIRNLGPILKKIIENPPSCDVFNCTDFQITWRELIKEYTYHLNINIIEQYKPFLSAIKKFHDKQYLLMISFSRFGCHYPNEKLKNKYKIDPIYSWKEGVKEAVDNYFRKDLN